MKSLTEAEPAKPAAARLAPHLSDASVYRYRGLVLPLTRPDQFLTIAIPLDVCPLPFSQGTLARLKAALDQGIAIGWAARGKSTLLRVMRVCAMLDDGQPIGRPQ